MPNLLSADSYRIETLSAAHDRGAFSCGIEELDHYLKRMASQDTRRGIAVVHVMVDITAPQTMLGFYSLSALSVPLGGFPDRVRKRLPKYPAVPVALIGRLATDLRSRGKKLGALLLVDALLRICQISEQSMGVYAVVVDAKYEDVVPFYLQFGFVRFHDSPLRLFIPVHTAREAVRDLL